MRANVLQLQVTSVYGLCVPVSTLPCSRPLAVSVLQAAILVKAMPRLLPCCPGRASAPVKRNCHSDSAAPGWRDPLGEATLLWRLRHCLDSGCGAQGESSRLQLFGSNLLPQRCAQLSGPPGWRAALPGRYLSQLQEVLHELGLLCAFTAGLCFDADRSFSMAAI